MVFRWGEFITRKKFHFPAQKTTCSRFLGEREQSGWLSLFFLSFVASEAEEESEQLTESEALSWPHTQTCCLSLRYVRANLSSNLPCFWVNSTICINFFFFFCARVVWLGWLFIIVLMVFFEFIWEHEFLLEFVWYVDCFSFSYLNSNLASGN